MTSNGQEMVRAPEHAVAPKESRDPVAALFERMKPEIAKALPRHITADRMARVALTACRRNPELLKCSQVSLAGALMTAAQLGLEPDGLLGQGYLIPRRVKGALEATFQVGYQGLMDLARRSGQIQTINANVVYEGDEFEHGYGLERDIFHHVPKYVTDDPKRITYAYAIARLTNGGYQFRVLHRREIEAARAKSQSDRVWGPHYAEMAKKTAITRLFKFLPRSPEMARAVADVDVDAEVEARAFPAGPQPTALDAFAGDSPPPALPPPETVVEEPGSDG